MERWLQDSLSSCRLSREARSYLYSRGVTDKIIEQMQLTTWSCPESVCPDETFVERYGRRGWRLRGRVICPYFSPRGNIVGFEARTFGDRKFISDIRAPSAEWNPIFLGMKESMSRIWDSGMVWIVEGIYDLAAMHPVIPEADGLLASLTANLSISQRRFLERFARYIFLVYDMDETGKKGIEKVKRYCERVGIRCIPVYYRGGKDPGVIWQRGGDEAIEEAFASTLRMRKSYGAL
jgi:DNA primase